MPWDDAGAYLRFCVTYLAKDEKEEDALMAGDGGAAGRAGVEVLEQLRQDCLASVRQPVKKATKTIWKSLIDVTWFANVGSPPKDKHVVSVKSWEEAMRGCLSRDWWNVTLEGSNVLRERIYAKSVKRFDLWNRRVDKVTALALPTVKKRLAKVCKEQNLKPKDCEEFITRVKLDVIGICMEVEYADLVKPFFYLTLKDWYSRGHLPCGWKGDLDEFPRGKLIVY